MSASRNTLDGAKRPIAVRLGQSQLDAIDARRRPGETRTDCIEEAIAQWVRKRRARPIAERTAVRRVQGVKSSAQAKRGVKPVPKGA